MPKEKDTPKEPAWLVTTLKICAAILKEIGITNFIIIFMCVVFIRYATIDQKKRFIDTWILFEGDKHAPCILVTISIVLLSVISIIYHARMLRLTRNELHRVGEERSELQRTLLKSKLGSSK